MAFYAHCNIKNRLKKVIPELKEKHCELCESGIKPFNKDHIFSLEFSALIAAQAITQPIIGKASDKFGRRVFIITGLICLIPIVLAEGIVTQPWEMITARALQGICSAMVFAPALALAGDLAEKGQTGSQLSVVTIAFGLGIFLGSFISRYAVRFGYVVPFMVGALLAGIGVLIITSQVPKNVNVSD